jgi:hypothetical protein
MGANEADKRGTQGVNPKMKTFFNPEKILGL